jgi:hypothetical protein
VVIAVLAPESAAADAKALVLGLVWPRVAIPM